MDRQSVAKFGVWAVHRVAVQGPISNDEENELQTAWTMEMPMMDGNISTTEADEEE